MIDISFTMFIPLSPKKTSKVYVHQLGQVVTTLLSDLHTNHIKDSL